MSKSKPINVVQTLSVELDMNNPLTQAQKQETLKNLELLYTRQHGENKSLEFRISKTSIQVRGSYKW